MSAAATRVLEFAGGAVTLRSEVPEDGSFLYRLFCQSRPPGESIDGLDPLSLETIMEFQCRAQSIFYREHFPAAHNYIVEKDEECVGRMIVDVTPMSLTIVDLSLMPLWRSKGLGESLIRDAQRSADSLDISVCASVTIHNVGCLRLCQRLGFMIVGTTATHFQLQYR